MIKSMTNLESQHDTWMFEQQLGGFITYEGNTIPIEIGALDKEDKIKFAHTRDGKTYYKLTRKGWEVIRNLYSARANSTK